MPEIDEEEAKARASFVLPKCLDPYDVRTFLGIGGYGIVFILENRENTLPALAVKKFITPFYSAKRAQRCFRELQILQNTDHENIVKRRLVFTPDASLATFEDVYLVTEYCGWNLTMCLEFETKAKKQVFKLVDFKRMISELLRALKYLNSAKVMHRDVTPGNLAIDEKTGKLTLIAKRIFTCVKIRVVDEKKMKSLDEIGRNLRLDWLSFIDFGLARVIDKCNQHTNNPGTEYYRAIETMEFDPNKKGQIKVYNEKADIWSIGAILCEMVTGSKLFTRQPENPLLAAIALCGPVGQDLIDQIDHAPTRPEIEKRSAAATRVDFLQHLQTKGRSWLQADIATNGEQLKAFIDRTLVFDHEDRMTVDQALAHPFLADVREQDKEVCASHAILDVPERSVEEWRKLLWDVVEKTAVTAEIETRKTMRRQAGGVNSNRYNLRRRGK